MPRTFGGLIFYGAQSITPSAVGTSAGQYALLQDASNVPYWGNTAGAATVFFVADDANVTRPYIQFPAIPGQYETSSGVLATGNEFQEAFGTTPASAGATAPGQPFGGNAAASPSTTASATLPTPQFGTPALPWGLSIKDIFVVYSVQTATLSAATVALYRTTFSTNAAYANVTVVPTTQLTLTLTATTSAVTPYVLQTALAQPLLYESIDYSQLSFVLSIGAAATSAVRVYGMGMHVIGCYT